MMVRSESSKSYFSAGVNRMISKVTKNCIELSHFKLDRIDVENCDRIITKVFKITIVLRLA